MSVTQTKTPPAPAAPPERSHSPKAPKSTMTTRLVAVGAAVVLAVVFVLLITSPPNDDAKPVSLGFSLNSLFRWLGNLNPIAQIPIILVIFGLVVALILLLIEFAPRSGNGYFWLRLAACFVIPVLALMLLRPYQNALIWVLVIALVVGALLFFADYRSRQGAGYLFQLVTFMAPAVLLLAIGLIYPTVATIYQSFFDKTSKTFVGLDNYAWVFTNPEGFWSVVNTLI
jgi:alpha-glucoside transport system permease protein